MKSINKKDIAVIGMAVELPKSANLKQYWHNLENGVDCIGAFPEGRIKDIKDYLTFLGKEDDGFVKAGYVENIDLFDNEFFNLTPKEAMLMSPSQRIFLETAYKAFCDANYDRKKLYKSKTGVYVGYIGDNEGHIYRDMLENLTDDFSSVAMSGNLSSIIAGRVSYTFNLTGPSMVIDTACSSSLVAIYSACRDINSGLCDMALAGGVKICMLPVDSAEKIGIESSDGKTKAFDEKADGTGIGEGCGAVVLKSLAKAERDGDYIYAVIRGGSINQDGASSGITAPNPAAQRDLYLQAWKDAGINPENISYIEAHGTGTKLGDPIEIDGLVQAFSKFTDKTQFCAIGSVKTNIGHLYEASAVASLIKTVLALNYKKIPKSLNFTMPNPQIDFIHSPFYVAGETHDWQKNGETLMAGVSAFGFSGTNCHLVLEEYNGREKPYMEDIEEKLEKSSFEIFNNKRFWFKTKYVPYSGGRAEKTEVEENVTLTGKERFTETELALGKLWSKHMGYESLNVNDNFFSLGGDSIIASKITSGIQKDLFGAIMPSNMFAFPTISAMAEFIDEAIGSDAKGKIQKLPPSEYYRASAEQQRLYIVYQIENKNGTYNMPFVAEFKEKIDRLKLEKAVKGIVERHETLRTGFFEKDGVIWQKIEPAGDFNLDFERVSENELKEKIAESQKPFDLGVPPLIRIKLFETELRSVIFVDMHHIVSDGTSMGIFIKELMSLYQGIALKNIEIHYKDFSAWQEVYLKSDTVKKQEKFWNDTFKDGIPVLRLPEDFKRPAERTTSGGSYYFCEDLARRQSVEKMAQAHACTTFVVLLSAYIIMLYRLSRQNSIVVGSPVSGRIHYQAVDLIGMFVNMIPFKADINEEENIGEFVEYMKDLVYKVYENQECQFETIASNNVKTRFEGRNAVMDVLFAYQNMEMPKLTLDGHDAEVYSVNNDSKYDLMLEIYNSKNGYNMRFEYYSAIFCESTIKSFSEIYHDVLKDITENESMTIKEICGSDEKELENVSIDFDF